MYIYLFIYYYIHAKNYYLIELFNSSSLISIM